MQSHYKNAALIFSFLLLLTGITFYLCWNYAHLYDDLLPYEDSEFAWKLLASTDEGDGGSSSITINDSSFGLDFDFFTTEGSDRPQISVSTEFSTTNTDAESVDFSIYSSLLFSVKCAPENTLAVSLVALTDKTPEIGQPQDHRLPTEYFHCTENWSQVSVALKHLYIPHWWMMENDIGLSDQRFNLSKINSIRFSNSEQTFLDTPSNVKISRLTLKGRNWILFYAFGFFLISAWAIFATWFFKKLEAGVAAKLQQDKAVVAYRQLSIEPKRDRDKNQVLSFLANKYADPDLNLESASNKLGINRNKINDILREELGMTFNTYLNKLRLTEAARLLTEKEDANVAEIASIVGYNNSSYFTKLFKKEFGHSPSSYKSIAVK